MAENCAVWVEKMFPLLGFSENFSKRLRNFNRNFTRLFYRVGQKNCTPLNSWPRIPVPPHFAYVAILPCEVFGSINCHVEETSKANWHAIADDAKLVGPYVIIGLHYFVNYQGNVKIDVTIVNNSCFSPYLRCRVISSSISSVVARRKKCTRQPPSCLQLCQVFTNLILFSLADSAIDLS